MLKKMFGLASVTVVSGILVATAATGCSSTKTYVIYDDGGDEGGSSGTSGTSGTSGSSGTSGTSGGIKKDGSAPVDEDADVDPPAGGSCPSTDPITSADVEAQLSWKPPTAPRNVCTQTNIDALRNLFKTAPPAGLSFADIKNTLGTTCSSCVFSPIAGATWSVFVEDAGGAIDNRTGSCFAQFEGANCGRSRFQWEVCLDVACSEAECGASGIAACVPKAQAGACSALTNTYAGACPGEANNIGRCGNVLDSIAISCSGGINHGLNVAP